MGEWYSLYGTYRDGSWTPPNIFLRNVPEVVPAADGGGEPAPADAGDAERRHEAPEVPDVPQVIGVPQVIDVPEVPRAEVRLEGVRPDDMATRPLAPVGDEVGLDQMATAPIAFPDAGGPGAAAELGDGCEFIAVPLPPPAQYNLAFIDVVLPVLFECWEGRRRRDLLPDVRPLFKVGEDAVDRLYLGTDYLLGYFSVPDVNAGPEAMVPVSEITRAGEYRLVVMGISGKLEGVKIVPFTVQRGERLAEIMYGWWGDRWRSWNAMPGV